MGNVDVFLSGFDWNKQSFVAVSVDCFLAVLWNRLLAAAPLSPGFLAFFSFPSRVLISLLP